MYKTLHAQGLLHNPYYRPITYIVPAYLLPNTNEKKLVDGEMMHPTILSESHKNTRSQKQLSASTEV